jgi:ABC-type sugar transport system substrate-binding protein
MLGKNILSKLNKNTRNRYQLIKSRGSLWFFGLVLTIALVACSITPEKTSQPKASPAFPADVFKPQLPTPQATSSPEIKATRPWKFVLAIKDKVKEDGKVVSPVWQEVWKAAKKAAYDFGVDVVLLPNPCQTCVTEQIKAIDSLTKQPKIDGLVIGAVDSLDLAPVVEKVISTGIPVIALDTPLNSDRLLTFVGFDNFGGGKAIGELVVAHLQGKGQVAILEGPPNQQNVIDRRNGFLAGLQQGNMEVVATKSGNWEADLARKITREWISSYPNLKAIIAANERMALAASAEAQAAKFPLLITAFGINDETVDAIKNGSIEATVNQHFDLQARLSIQLLIRHLENKETFPPFLPPLSKISIITKNNVKDYQQDNSSTLSISAGQQARSSPPEVGKSLSPIPL